MWNLDGYGAGRPGQEEASVCIGRDKHVWSSLGCGAFTWWSLHGLANFDLEILLLGEPT